MSTNESITAKDTATSTADETNKTKHNSSSTTEILLTLILCIVVSVSVFMAMTKWFLMPSIEEAINSQVGTKIAVLNYADLVANTSTTDPEELKRKLRTVITSLEENGFVVIEQSYIRSKHPDLQITASMVDSVK